jgi:hypothetical protein
MYSGENRPVRDKEAGKFLDQWETRKQEHFSTSGRQESRNILMLLSEQSLESVSVSKKQAETLYYFSLPKGRLNI